MNVLKLTLAALVAATLAARGETYTLCIARHAPMYAQLLTSSTPDVVVLDMSEYHTPVVSNFVATVLEPSVLPALVNNLTGVQVQWPWDGGVTNAAAETRRRHHAGKSEARVETERAYVAAVSNLSALAGVAFDSKAKPGALRVATKGKGSSAQARTNIADAQQRVDALAAVLRDLAEDEDGRDRAKHWAENITVNP